MTDLAADIGQSRYGSLFATGLTLNPITTADQFPSIASNNNRMHIVLDRNLVYKRSNPSPLKIDGKHNIVVMCGGASMLRRPLQIQGGCHDILIDGGNFCAFTRDEAGAEHSLPAGNADALIILGTASPITAPRMHDPLLDPANIVIHECAFMGSQDEIASVLRNTKDVALLRNVFMAPIAGNNHDYGVLMGQGVINGLFKGNMVAGCVQRLPMVATSQPHEDPYLENVTVRVYDNILIGSGRLTGGQSIIGLSNMMKASAYGAPSTPFLKVAISGNVAYSVNYTALSELFTPPTAQGMVYSGKAIMWEGVNHTLGNTLNAVSGASPVSVQRFVVPEFLPSADLGVLDNPWDQYNAISRMVGPSFCQDVVMTSIVSYDNAASAGGAPPIMTKQSELFKEVNWSKPTAYYADAATPSSAEYEFEQDYLRPLGLKWGAVASPAQAMALYQKMKENGF